MRVFCRIWQWSRSVFLFTFRGPPSFRLALHKKQTMRPYHLEFMLSTKQRAADAAIDALFYSDFDTV